VKRWEVVIRLPFQILVYVSRRPTLTTKEFLLLKRTAARGGFWQGESRNRAARRKVEEAAGYKQLICFYSLDHRYRYPFGGPDGDTCMRLRSR
jgi:hypothetical protein